MIKLLLGHVEKGEMEKAKKLLPDVMSAIDTAAKKNLIHENNAAHKKSRVQKAVTAGPPKKEEKPEARGPLPLLLQGFEMAAKEEEWVHLGSMGNALRRLDPAFDARTYGHQKLQALIKDYPKTFVLKRDKSRTPPVLNVALTAQAGKD